MTTRRPRSEWWIPTRVSKTDWLWPPPHTEVWMEEPGSSGSNAGGSFAWDSCCIRGVVDIDPQGATVYLRMF